MLNLSELAVLRGWIMGLPAAVTVREFLTDFDGNAEAFIRGKLEALALKAHRAGKPEWAATILQRPDTEAGQRRVCDILDRLAHMQDPAPAPEHPVDFWLPPQLAETCKRCGAETLVGLNRVLDRLPVQSRRLVQAFLEQNGLLPETGQSDSKVEVECSKSEGGPGEKVSGTNPVEVFVKNTITSIAPLERIIPPEELDGSQGSNRSPGYPRIDAANDYEAIQIWLSLWPKDSNTYKAYRREAERFLLWCLIERCKAFSSVTAEDCIAYRNFLKDPRPTERWIGPPRPRPTKDWKPFRGPLSDRSIHQAEIILGSLCQWLVDQRWLDSNPFAALPKRRMTTRMRTDHALTEAQWRFVLDYADRRIKQAETEEQRRGAIRLRFVLEFAYLTGLRISELAAARIGDIEPVVRRGGTQYWLIVRGKGGKERSVPLPQKLVALLVDYLRERGWVLDHPEQAPPETPVIASVRHRLQIEEGGFAKREVPVTPLALHHMLRDFFQEAGAELAKQDPAAGKRLSQATAHWLRHTHGSHALDRGIPLTVVRDNLGHASIQTTSLYVHKDADERFQEMEKLSNK